ncbi:WD repeat-containing protein 54-like [Planococcus citri]|uniref:WD repeat-containing protein 54-like n=1 Tax=Planococcus citri TaxID=170843 RepID=UPI0031F8412C
METKQQHIRLSSVTIVEMYKKVDCILLPYSASAVYNNLSVKSEKTKKTDTLCFIHHDTVCIAPTKASAQNKTKFVKCSKFNPDRSIHVTQVAWCNLGYETILIVTSTVGLQVFDQHGEECIFSHPCSDVTERYDRGFARGIGIFNAFYFCIGNSAGCIRMFGPPDLEDEISFIDRKHNHMYAITDLSAYKEYLISADEEGIIMVWHLETEELIHKMTIASQSHCIGIKLVRDFLVATYGCGKIRLYNVERDSHKSRINTLNVSLEVAAHARAITSFDISENNEYLITVSEDCYCKIWQFYKDGNSQMLKHVANILIKDSMLLGCKFLTTNGSKFCVSTYDSNIVTCYSL